MVKGHEIGFPISEEQAGVLDAAAKVAGVDMWVVRGLRKSRGLPPLDYFLDHSTSRIQGPEGAAECEASTREPAMRLFTGWAKSELNEQKIDDLTTTQDDQFSKLLEYMKLSVVRDEKEREFRREQKALDRQHENDLAKRGPTMPPLQKLVRGRMDLEDAG